jgi:hypothetical protein
MIIARGFGAGRLVVTRGYGFITIKILALPAYIFKRASIIRVFTRVRLR